MHERLNDGDTSKEVWKTIRASLTGEVCEVVRKTMVHRSRSKADVLETFSVRYRPGYIQISLGRDHNIQRFKTRPGCRVSTRLRSRPDEPGKKRPQVFYAIANTMKK